MENFKLNENIGFYRKKLDLTQEELAQKLGVTNQTVSKWESAKSCPDISLIPKIADIFGISIDELFGREAKLPFKNNDSEYEFPWQDDETLRIFFARGRKILSKMDDINECVNVRFPLNCNETTRQYFKVEVYGNVACDASINGDVVSSGDIECNQINGDIKECKGNISCKGDINCGGDVQCRKITGNVECQGNITYK